MIPASLPALATPAFMALPLFFLPSFLPVLPLSPLLSTLRALFMCCILGMQHWSCLNHPLWQLHLFQESSPHSLLQPCLSRGVLVVHLSCLSSLPCLPSAPAHYLGRLNNTQELHAKFSALYLQLHRLHFTNEGDLDPKQDSTRLWLPGFEETVRSHAWRGCSLRCS